MCYKELLYFICSQDIEVAMSINNSSQKSNSDDEYDIDDNQSLNGSYQEYENQIPCPNDVIYHHHVLSDCSLEDTISESSLEDTSCSIGENTAVSSTLELSVISQANLIKNNSDANKVEAYLEPKLIGHNHDTIDLEEAKNEEKGNRSLKDEKFKFQALVTQCELKLEELNTENISLRNRIAELKVKLNHQEREQEVEFKKLEAKSKAEFLTNIEKLSRECNNLRKEKEAIVIRYANSEKEVIKDKKIHQDLERKLKDLNKDRENILLKLKNVAAENVKLSSSVENKMVEIAKLQKENEKLNADFSSREVRIKWLQNKLKSEVNAHQETQKKLDQTLHRLNEMREEAEQVRRDCQDMIKCYQEAEEIKSVKLDCQLKQKVSELEVQKQEKCDQEQVYVLLRQELEALKKKQRLTMDENNSLTLKINSLEKERLDYEQTLCKFKDNQNLLNEEIADLTSQLAEMDGVKLQLEGEKEKSAAALREVERLRLTNAEFKSDLDACHMKEGDRLDFVEKLTAKTMLLQSDHCLLEVKAEALEDEVNELKKTLSDLQQNHVKLIDELAESQREYESETQLLVLKLAEKAKSVEMLNKELDEAANENRVLKKRHITSIKELSRELSQCKRRLESFECNAGFQTEIGSLDSRTSSSASHHVSNSNDMSLPSPSISFSGKKDISSHQKNNSESDFILDKEVLIERIISLQKMLAKKTDKIDFLEDHIQHLTREMRKKCKSVDFKNV